MRRWQRDFLDSIGERLRAGVVDAGEVIREATASGHGIGKSALVSMLIKWAMDARGDAINAALASDELSGNARAQKAITEAGALIVAPSAAETLAERVAAHAYRRAVQATLREAYQRASAAGPPLVAVTSATEALAAMPKGPRARLDDSMRASVKATLKRIDDRRKAAEGGIRATARWGVRALDGWHCEEFGFYEGAVGGLFPGKLYVLAGLPGGGKTSLVWQAALATAGGDEKSKGKRVLLGCAECRPGRVNRAGAAGRFCCYPYCLPVVALPRNTGLAGGFILAFLLSEQCA